MATGKQGKSKTAIAPDGGFVAEGPQVVVTVDEGTTILEVLHSEENYGKEAVAYLIQGIPGINLQLVDLRNLPAGMAARLVWMKHATFGTTIIDYQADTEPILQGSLEEVLPVSDVLTLLDWAVNQDTALELDRYPADISSWINEWAASLLIADQPEQVTPAAAVPPVVTS